MNKGITTVNKFNLPNTLETTLPQIEKIMNAFNLPREIIASNEEIYYAWQELPREIMRIPSELRDELIVKMCVATSVGLFDGAINYIWNAVIITLRKKIKSFGLSLVAETLNREFTEENLNDYRDSQLLDLCYKLELLSEEGFFFLNQCRDIRNNFSIAHPSMAQIDDRELITFISRCCKYGITYDYSLKGVNVSDFLSSLKVRKLEDDELEIWKQKLIDTFPAQRQMLIPTLMGIYCDPNSTEITRVNSLKICVLTKDYIDDKAKSSMLELYNKYFVKGDTAKTKVAKIFFEKLKILDLLSTSEQHAIIKNACDNLTNAHLEYDNFYNEPPFAQRLYELTMSIKTPISIQKDYVSTVAMCYVGNPYGVSRGALYYYKEMIRNFSPREIEYFLNLLNEQSLFSNRIKNYQSCKTRYKDAVQLIDKESVNANQLNKINEILSL